MRSRWPILLLLLCTSPLLAQKETPDIDSLKKKLLKPKNDTDRAFLMDGIAKEYFNVNLDSSVSYGTRALALARKTNVAEYQVDALNSLGVATRRKGDYKKALEFHNEGLKICRDKKLHSFYFMNVYSAICLVHTEQGNYAGAIEYGYNALLESEKGKDTLNQAITNNNLADIYFNMEQYPKALIHYKKALVISKQLKNLYGEGLLSGNIGSVYFSQGKLDSSKVFFETALDISRKVQDVFGEGTNLMNLGNYYEKKGQIKEAIGYYEKGEVIFRENQLDPELAVAYTNLASCYLKLRDPVKAKEFGHRSLAYAEKINSYPDKESAHHTLNEVYEAMHDTKLAYHHYREYVAARDSTANQANRKALFKSELLYEYTKKRDADSLSKIIDDKMQAEKLHQEELRTHTQRKFKYAALGGCALLLILVVFIFKGYRDKQKANRIISAQKEEVELQKTIIEEKQKEILDSIHYAKRIQTSLLPSEKYLERALSQFKRKK